jgi:DNA modification methylase
MRDKNSIVTRHTVTANHHPTVKPTALMQYLVRLITPPNGIVLDPFMGSGSTGKACAYEGFDFIGIDQSAEYVEIARARIEFALQEENTKEDEKEYELPF